jgi:hypothetical protein
MEFELIGEEIYLKTLEIDHIKSFFIKSVNTNYINKFLVYGLCYKKVYKIFEKKQTNKLFFRRF